MSSRARVGFAAVAAMILAGGAFFWLRLRSDPSLRTPTFAIKAASADKPAAPAPAVALPPDKSIRAEAAPPVDARKSPAAEPNSGLPLRSGEILDYVADIAKLSNVATLRLQVAERRNFLGKNAWHLQAFAHTANPLRMVFELDDQFDSYSDAGTLSSLQYEMHLSERGQKVESVQRMTATGKDPAPANATAARVLPGTRDPLGMMQYLRSVDWSITSEFRGPVYDGHKLYDVRATLDAPSETVTVPAGTFPATKIQIHAFENGVEMSDAHFALYLAHNDARTPVLLEAVLPWTTARVELKSTK
jgi:hypothetical protein